MTTGPETRWIPLCATAGVAADVPQRVEIAGHPPFAVFKLDDGFHVTADTCTHGEASLSEGFVEGDEIECPWHSGKFCIRDGRAVAFPAIEPIRVYRARVIGDEVCIDLHEAPDAAAGAQP